MTIITMVVGTVSFYSSFAAYDQAGAVSTTGTASVSMPDRVDSAPLRNTHKQKNNKKTNKAPSSSFASGSAWVEKMKEFERSAARPSAAVAPLESLRQSFLDRYGKEMGIKLLEKGLHDYGNIQVTAKRLLQAKHSNKPFVMAFAGYSVTVGRGNHFSQSFPFVLERLWKPILQETLGVDLVVRNAAIGGIPSFPYGFCMEHFLGDDADVISWDYSMNEGKGAGILESYIRFALSSLSKQPMLIVLDNNRQRAQLLEQYTKELELLHDGITLKRGSEIVPKNMVEGDNVQQDQLPLGLQNWTEFGSPPRCPGRGSWHPRKAEHELMGWILAVYFLEVTEIALELEADGDGDRTTPFDDDKVISSLPSSSTASTTAEGAGQIIFPPNLASAPNGIPRPVNHLLYGHPLPNTHNRKLVMKQVSCRTSFLPAQDESTTLPTVVVSGLVEPDLDMMKDRTDQMYGKGWVLDVSKVERDTKRKVDRCGGLGYIDMKVALYGIPDSGTLRLFLPLEPQQHHIVHEHGETEDDLRADHWVDDILLCEANDKRSDEACKLERDLDLEIGGAPVHKVTPVEGAGVYLNRKTCVHIGLPKTAVVQKLSTVKKTDGTALTAEDQERWKQQLKKKTAGNQDILGLVVDITPKAPVNRKDGACCLSHILWEQH